MKEMFPKLNASCFIIANLDCSIILSELNSNKRIHTGTFDDIIFSSKVDLENLKKENNPSLGNNKLTLYEMNNILFHILKHKQYNFQIHHGKTSIFIIKSAMSGYGCVFSYKNNGNYIGIIYGCNTEDNVLEDIKNITNWLNQFYILDISYIDQNLTEVPLLYGEEKTIKLIEQTPKILMSKFCSGKIERTYHYKTIASAPIKDGDVLGTVFYFSEVFKNPIKIPLIAIKSIKKSSLFNRIIDTIRYIIFGASNSKNQDLFQNISE